MFVVLGASGHIGSAVASGLREAGMPVLAVVHGEEKARALSANGVEAVACDLLASAALRDVMRRGRRAFLLNPPGDPAGDSNANELASGRSIADALDGSGLEKVVVASTYGAQPGDGIGDLSTLYQFEQAVLATGIPAAINRGAYYFTNLDMLADSARSGIVVSSFPPDMILPMVAPVDLAAVAVERLQSSLGDVGIIHVEGPERYSFADVAAAFARQLKRDVTVQTTPRSKFEEAFRAVGFSPESAQAFARMTAATMDAPDLPSNPRRGRVSLDAYIAGLLGGNTPF